MTPKPSATASNLNEAIEYDHDESELSESDMVEVSDAEFGNLERKGSAKDRLKRQATLAKR